MAERVGDESPPEWVLSPGASKVFSNAADINELLTTHSPPAWVTSSTPEKDHDAEAEYYDPLNVQITPTQMNWYLNNTSMLSDDEEGDPGETQSPPPSASTTYRI